MFEKRCTWPTICFYCFCLMLPIAEGSLSEHLQQLKLKEKTIKKITAGKIVSNCEFETLKDKKQKMQFKALGLSPHSCTKTLRKISRYESYHKWLSMVDHSGYNEKTQEIYLAIKQAPIPVRWVLQFKLPRMTKPGDYPFSFDHGVFEGLKGVIHVTEWKKGCLLHATGDWQGKETGFSDTLLEIFAEHVLYKGLDRLIHLSKI